MRKHQIALLCLALVASLLATGSLAADAKDDAVKAAESWLALVDSGEFSKSWNQAATLFKGAVTDEMWQQSLGAARKPLGELISRKVESARYATSLPGAPDGEYVVIRFKASFSKKASAVETVTPMKEPDGEWRVAGYFIQ